MSESTRTEPLTGSVRERDSAATICPWCRDALALEPARACPDCGTSLHAACWSEATRCPALGCDGRPAGLNPVRVLVRSTTRFPEDEEDEAPEEIELRGDERFVVTAPRVDSGALVDVIAPIAGAIGLASLAHATSVLQALVIMTAGLLLFALAIAGRVRRRTPDRVVTHLGVFRGLGTERDRADRELAWTQVQRLELVRDSEGRPRLTVGGTGPRGEVELILNERVIDFPVLGRLVGAHLRRRRRALEGEVDPALAAEILGWPEERAPDRARP